MSVTNLITFDCPNCTSALEATEGTLRIRCKYCKQDIDIDRCSVTARSNTDSRLSTYEGMAKNALSISDFDSAETYYRLICELNSTKANMLRYNICCFLNGNVPYNNSFIEDIRIINDADALMLLKYIYKFVKNKMNSEIAAATEYCTTESVRNQKTEVVKQAYANTLNAIANKVLEYDPEGVEQVETSSLKPVRYMPVVICGALAVAIAFLVIFLMNL